MKKVVFFCIAILFFVYVRFSNNEKIGICFTGQGVKIAGVCNDFIKNVPAVSKEYEKIKQTTGLTDEDILTGKDADLFTKGKAQLALVVVQYLIFKGICTLCPNLHFDYAIGQSLGNYTALLVSGAFPSENLFSFVKLRDKLSAEFSKSSDQPYGMLVVKGISENDVKKYVDNESTFIAGLNMPTCFTISGVKKEIGLLKEKIQRDIPGIWVKELNVLTPFHTNLMKPLVDRLWDSFPVRHLLKMPIISDATGQIYTSPEAFNKDWMEKQLTSPMKWSGENGVCNSIRKQGLTRIVVVGDGQGLANMIKENMPNMKVYVVKTTDQLNEIVRYIKKVN